MTTDETMHPGLAPHQGFSNAATWSVALFLDNDSYETMTQARKIATGIARNSAALRLRRFVEKSNWRPESWVRVVSRSNTLDKVNWLELADHMVVE
jgi:hypothetical protein